MLALFISALDFAMSITSLIDIATFALAVKGVRERFEKMLGVKNFTMQYHNNWKQGLRATRAKGTDYPYGGFKITQFELDGAQFNFKNMARAGTGESVTVDNSNTSIRKFFLFPVKLSFECVVKFSDPKEAWRFDMALAVLMATGRLDFKVAYGGDTYQTRITFGSGNSASVPAPYIDDLNEGSTPGTSEISFSLTVETKIGFYRDVSKLNNYGAVTLTIDPTGQSKDPEDAMAVAEVQELLAGSEQYFKPTVQTTGAQPDGQQATGQSSILEP